MNNTKGVDLEALSQAVWTQVIVLSPITRMTLDELRTFLSIGFFNKMVIVPTPHSVALRIKKRYPTAWHQQTLAITIVIITTEFKPYHKMLRVGRDFIRSPSIVTI